MITLIVTFLVAHAGALLGLMAGGVGILFGVFSHKSAQTTKAKADASVAQANQQVAAAGQQVAQENAQAAQAQTDAIENAQSAQQAAGLATASTIDQQLAALGALRKE